MKFFFDECLPPKWFRHLVELLGARKLPITAFHLLDKLKGGTTDDAVVQWLLEQAPPATLISGDSGKKSKAGDPRMHLLCPRRGITSVFISPKLCQEEGFEKFRMILVCMPQLERAYDAPPGSRYRLERHGDYYRLRDWPVPPGTFSSIADHPPDLPPPFTLSS